MTGTVTFTDGTPLSGGEVAFRPIEAAPQAVARGRISDEGSFELSTFEPGDGALPGEYKVAIYPPMPEGDMDELMRRGMPEVIDPKYRDFETSGLAFTVTNEPSRNHFEIRVTPPSKVPRSRLRHRR